MRGDQPAFVVGVGDGLPHSHFLDQTGFLDVQTTTSAVAPRRDGVHERLVKQVLDHHRGVALGGSSQRVAPVLGVELGRVAT